MPTCERERSPFITHLVPSEDERSSQGIFAAAFSSSDPQCRSGFWWGLQVSCWILGFVPGYFTLSQLCLVIEGCDSFWKWGAKSFPLKSPGQGGRSWELAQGCFKSELSWP